MHDLLLSAPPLLVAIAIGTAGIVFAQIFRFSEIRSVLSLLVALVIGAVAGVWIIHGLIVHAGVERVHRLTPLLDAAIAKVDPNRDQIVLVGQSLSYYGLNGEQLETIINGGTRRYQIIQLTVEGSYPIDQDFVLSTYLAKASRPPMAVFFDFGFDSVYFPSLPPEQAFMELPLAASNWSRTAQKLAIDWRLNWPTIQQAHFEWAVAAKGLQSLISETSSSLSHFLCHATNCGILFHVKNLPPGSGYITGFKERTGHAAGFRPSDIAEPVALRCAGQSRYLAPSLAFRRWQADKYRASGISSVAFYFPPLQNMNSRCFATAFCEAIGDSPCINGENDKLLNELKSPELWYDVFHLNQSGVPIYTASFAKDLKEVLDRGRADMKNSRTKNN